MNRLDEYLREVRTLILEELEARLPPGGAYGPVLYDLMRDYPLRPAKHLRPALCIAMCGALGGRVEACLPTALALELYHNAFLLHDDVEDASVVRRGRSTLHVRYGSPVAINVGDAMLAWTLQPLLDNTRIIGLGPALRVLELMARMARESAEGQALELDWVRRGAWDLNDDDYFEMVRKKTSWYSFITPLLAGAAIAERDVDEPRLVDLGTHLGGSFQIQDDVLNLIGDPDRVGKELGGDLWEGKRTLVVLHALRHASAADADRARAFLDRRGSTMGPPAPLLATIAQLVDEGRLDGEAARMLAEAAGGNPGEPDPTGAAHVMALIAKAESTTYAKTRARDLVRRADTDLSALRPDLLQGPHLDFLKAVVEYVERRAL